MEQENQTMIYTQPAIDSQNAHTTAQPETISAASPEAAPQPQAASPAGAAVQPQAAAQAAVPEGAAVQPQVTPQTASEDSTVQPQREEPASFATPSPDSAEAFSQQEEAVRKKAYEETYEEIYREILENLHAFTPSDQVACRITEEHITSYLENNHEERILQYRERRDKRFLKTVELVAALAAVSFIVYSLKDNSAILVTLLYIIAALGGLYLWKSLKKPEGGTFLSKDNEEDRS